MHLAKKLFLNLMQKLFRHSQISCKRAVNSPADGALVHAVLDVTVPAKIAFPTVAVMRLAHHPIAFLKARYPGARFHNFSRKFMADNHGRIIGELVMIGRSSKAIQPSPFRVFTNAFI